MVSSVSGSSFSQKQLPNATISRAVCRSSSSILVVSLNASTLFFASGNSAVV